MLWAQTPSFFSRDDFQGNHIDISLSVLGSLLFFSSHFGPCSISLVLPCSSNIAVRRNCCSCCHLMGKLSLHGLNSSFWNQIKSFLAQSCCHSAKQRLPRAIPAYGSKRKSWSDGWIYTGKCYRLSRKKFLGWSGWNGASLIMDQICKVLLDLYYF